MEMELLIQSGPLAGSQVLLSGSSMVIGREDDCEININSQGISRYHSKLTFEDGTWYLKDLESTNGTYLNGEAIKKKTAVKIGDKIRISDVEMELVHGSNQSMLGNSKLTLSFLAFILIGMCVIVVWVLSRPVPELYSLDITSIPSGAEVLHNGKRIGETPLHLKNLEPGNYRFALSKKGHREKIVTLSVPQSDAIPLIELDPLIKDVGPDVLSVITIPGQAEIYLNGDLVGRSEAQPGSRESYPFYIKGLKRDTEYLLQVRKGDAASTVMKVKLGGQPVKALVWLPDHVVKLKNGQRYLAMISAETETSYKLMIGPGNKVEFKKDDIDSIEEIAEIPYSKLQEMPIFNNPPVSIPEVKDPMTD